MCHCTQCQKGQGTAFVAAAPVATEKLTFVRGQEFLKEYRSSPGKVRAFCAECGSPVYSARDDLPGVRRLRVGTLDTAVEAGRKYHAFVASKARWYEIRDEFPRYQGPST
ncbi:GFA family protein [Aquisalimonas lutea]|nr:GFA family protein [Aquisalimonas lutea]MDN3519402.1 GFA family protein [Aquisalimonas lutea]